MIQITEYQFFEPLTLYIKWQCDVTEAAYFKIYRGVTPEGVSPIAQTRNNYISDISLIKDQVFHDIHVKIEAYNTTGTLVDTLEEQIVSKDLHNYLKYYKWFQTNFLKATLASANGHRVAVLQKKHTGEICPVCAHQQTLEPTNPRCTTCWGTGFTGGFYSPFVYRVLFANFMENTRMQGSENHTQQSFESVVALAQPRLFDGDYLINLDTGIRYRVQGAGAVFNRYDFKRLGSVTYTTERLGSNHPIYNYPIEEDLTDVTSVSLNRENATITIEGSILYPRYGVFLLLVADTTSTISDFENGSGNTLNDVTMSGTYAETTEADVVISIDSTGTPDTFTWSLDGGTTWEATGVAITGSAQALGSTGISVTFANTTGHGSSDTWTMKFNEAPTLAYEEEFTAADMKSLTPTKIVVSISSEIAKLANSRYQVSLNNEFFLGDVTNED